MTWVVEVSAFQAVSSPDGSKDVGELLEREGPEGGLVEPWTRPLEPWAKRLSCLRAPQAGQFRRAECWIREPGLEAQRCCPGTGTRCWAPAPPLQPRPAPASTRIGPKGSPDWDSAPLSLGLCGSLHTLISCPRCCLQRPCPSRRFLETQPLCVRDAVGCAPSAHAVRKTLVLFRPHSLHTRFVPCPVA